MIIKRRENKISYHTFEALVFSWCQHESAPEPPGNRGVASRLLSSCNATQLNSTQLNSTQLLSKHEADSCLYTRQTPHTIIRFLLIHLHNQNDVAWSVRRVHRRNETPRM